MLAIGLIVSLFFLWGVANNLNDILIKQFKKAFVLTDLETGFVQSAFYMGYFLLALPAGLIMRRYGYKAAVVVGLALYGLGALLFYPAAQLATYGMFLAALFVIASGLAFLETAANPLITVLGDPATSERRLNLAQSFNPLGAIAGLLIGKYFILSGVEHSEETLAGMSQAEQTAFYTSETQAVAGPHALSLGRNAPGAGRARSARLGASHQRGTQKSPPYVRRRRAVLLRRRPGRGVELYDTLCSGDDRNG